MNGTKVVCLIAIFAMAGCATAIPLSYKERCAVKGMKLTGVSSNTGYASTSGNNWTRFNTYEESENVNCVVPSNQQEECEINKTLSAAEPKISYNDSLRTRRTIETIGYVLLIAPGVVASVLNSNAKSNATDKSRSIASENSGQCKFSTSTPTP